MKAIMQSTQHKWCELTATGEKTIEVRKTRPKIETPFKVYMYCTKDKKQIFWQSGLYRYIDDRSHNLFDKPLNGKVIGEYVCDSLIQINYNKDGYGLDSSAINGVIAKSCIGEKDLYKYLKGKKPYLYHISDLVIYDTPKELRDFMSAATGKPLPRPSQSWCYVKEIKTDE